MTCILFLWENHNITIFNLLFLVQLHNYFIIITKTYSKKQSWSLVYNFCNNLYFILNFLPEGPPLLSTDPPNPALAAWPCGVPASAKRPPPAPPSPPVLKKDNSIYLIQITFHLNIVKYMFFYCYWSRHIKFVLGIWD